MKDDNRIITPNEMNKYTYCPFQWYYERYYGKAELRARARKRNEAAGRTDARLSHFAAGNAHHDKIYRQVKQRKASVSIALAILFVLICGILYVMLRG